MGLVPAGAYANRKFVGDKVEFSEDVPEEVQDVLYDPQTSGGLLISLPKENVDLLLKNLKNTPTKYAVVGEVIEKEDKYIIVKWKEGLYGKQ